jgi:hypothetical protein
MIRFQLIFIFISFCLMYSCNTSDKEALIKGYVMDYYSNKPVNNYRLNIIGQRSFDIDGGYSKVDSFKTDSNGMFSISFICEHDYGYKISAGIQNDYSSIEEKDIDWGKTNDFLFKVKPYTNLQLKLINKTQKFSQISISTSFWERWVFNDTIISIKNAIPDDSIKLSIYLYYRNIGSYDTIIKQNIWIEHKDTVFYKLEL